MNMIKLFYEYNMIKLYSMNDNMIQLFMNVFKSLKERQAKVYEVF